MRSVRRALAMARQILSIGCALLATSALLASCASPGLEPEPDLELPNDFGAELPDPDPDPLVLERCREISDTLSRGTVLRTYISRDPQWGTVLRTDKELTFAPGKVFREAGARNPSSGQIIYVVGPLKAVDGSFELAPLPKL